MAPTPSTVALITQTEASGEATRCGTATDAGDDPLVLQTSVVIDGASPLDIGCEAAEAFVTTAAAAAGIDAGAVTYWLEPADGGGSLLVIQMRVATREDANTVLTNLAPELQSTTNQAALTGGAQGAQVTWSDSDAERTFVMEGQMAGETDSGTSGSDGDGETFGTAAIAIIAALGVVCLALAAMLCCGCCAGGKKRDEGDEGEENDGKQGSGRRKSASVQPASQV